MATRTPSAPPSENGTETPPPSENGTENPPSADGVGSENAPENETLPDVPAGYRRLGDVTGTPRKNDPYAALRGMVGKDLTIVSANIARDLKSGTATVAEFGDDNAPSIQVPIPLGSIRRVAAAIQYMKENNIQDAIVVRVIQTGRGVAFR